MNKFASVLAGAVFTLSKVSAAVSQSIVGIAMVEGKRVELYDNGTWEFSDLGEQSCFKIAAKLSFCGNPLKWKPTKVPNSEVNAAFNLDDRNYGMVVYEGVGTKDGMSLPMMQSVALEYAADAMGLPPSQVPVYGLDAAQVEGHATETLYYSASIEGMSIIYANTAIVGDHDTVQIITYTLADDIDDAFKARHADFLADFDVKFWEEVQ